MGEASEEENADPEGSRKGPVGDGFGTLRGAALVIAAGVVVAFLYLARAMLVPVVLAIFLAYVLNPLVDVLRQVRFPRTDIRLPRGVAVAIVVGMVTAFGIATSFVVADQLRQFGSEIPQYAEQVADQVGDFRSRVREMENFVETRLERVRGDEPAGATAADPAESKGRAEEAEQRVREVIVRQGTNLWSRLSPYVAGGLTGLMGWFVQALTCLFVLFFVLTQAPNFKHKFLKILGTTDRRRELTLEVFQDINRDVQRYLFARTLINAGLAVSTGFAFFVLGLRYALLLGLMAGLLNFIPYFGGAFGVIIVWMIGYVQFGTVWGATVPIIFYFLLNSVEGYFVTPVYLGRHLQLNSLAVLLGLVFWGWVWGPIGMILSIPILAVMRVIAEHVERLEPVAVLLRRG